MTPEKRLDQLEPLVAEVSAQLDRVTAQNRQVAAAVSQVIEAVTAQSDNIQFLLRETAIVKQDIAELKTGQIHLQEGQENLTQKVDLILKILQAGNGRS